MELLLTYVKENPDFKNNYNITEESVRQLFAENTDIETIDQILQTAKEMNDAVDYNTINDMMKKKEDDNDDLLDGTIDHKVDDFMDDDKKFTVPICSNLKSDNMFNTPLQLLTPTQLLALNIATNCLDTYEKKRETPILSNWTKLASNKSALTKVNSVLEPLSSESTTKLGKMKFNTIQKIYSQNNPELLKRLRKEIADNYEYRSRMFNKNKVGGQNTLLERDWLENFPLGNETLDHLNLYSSLNVRDMDKINDME